MDSNRTKYFFRIALILIMYALIKGFDKSYDGLFDFSGRSVFFCFGFIFYWMIIWGLSSWLITGFENKLRGKLKSFSLLLIAGSIILVLAIGAAILFNLLYRWCDVNLFGMQAHWEKVPFPHPELIYPLILLSLQIFMIDRFINFSTQLKNTELYAAHLEQDNIQARYDALKNQVDPHFFFNSLSVLSSIVHTDPDLASRYIYNLSKMYRYTLENKQNNAVPLTDELNFLDSYLFLVKIRYPQNLNFTITLDRSVADRLGIHPFSLQLLIENAIKHNKFNDNEPLDIEIFEEDEYLCVSNPIRKRKQIVPSTGIGLENIRKRYELHNQKKIVIQETDGYFVVKLPKIEIY